MGLLQQFGCPSGPLGRLAGTARAVTNTPLVQEVIAAVAVPRARDTHLHSRSACSPRTAPITLRPAQFADLQIPIAEYEFP
jgi:hypothetical protein